jgi:hypothetical protein
MPPFNLTKTPNPTSGNVNGKRARAICDRFCHTALIIAANPSAYNVNTNKHKKDTVWENIEQNSSYNEPGPHDIGLAKRKGPRANLIAIKYQSSRAVPMHSTDMIAAWPSKTPAE